MEFRDLVAARHSVRDFRPDPVPRDLIEQVIAAASLAPSPANLQPWHFYVTTGESRSALGRVVAQSTVHLQEYVDVAPAEKIEEATRWYSYLGEAPVVIAVAMERAESEFDELNRQLAVGAALENLMLAATDLGLATCNITFSYWVRDEIAEFLSAPSDRKIVAIVAVGYPTDEPPVAPAHNADVATYLD
jgi:nitroreductase